MTPKSPFRFLILSILVILLDQATKIIVRHFMELYQSIPVLGNFFMLTYVENPGVAFSIGFDSPAFNRIFFSIVTFLLIFVILYMLKCSKSIWEKIAYSFILGGAVGNLIDRVFLGAVTDFFDADFFTINIFGFYMERWPVFNIADSSIVVAVVILLFYTIFLEKGGEEIQD